MRWAILFVAISNCFASPAFSQSIFDDQPATQPANKTSSPPADDVAPRTASPVDPPVSPVGSNAEIEATAKQRLPVPAGKDLSDATALMNDTYKDDFAAVKSPEQKQAMVQQLLKVAGDEKGAAIYALLTKAKGLAIESGDLDGCDAALDGIEKSFVVDSSKERDTAYAAIEKSIHTPAGRRQLSDDLSSTAHAAVAEDQFQDARTATELELRVARAAGEAELIQRASADGQKVQSTEAAYVGIKKSLLLLRGTPTDPEANLAVGKYRCFIKDDWKNGLPNLASGSDARLKSAARAETGGMSAADDQVNLADQWWVVAAALTGSAKANVEAHASHWYQAAVPSLTGLSKFRILKRIEEASASAQQAAGPVVAEKSFSLVVEALIDGSSELHIVPTGIYWVEKGVSKPGMHGKTRLPTFVNGTEWWPKWGRPDEEKGNDKTQPLQMRIGNGDLDFEILAITDRRGQKGIADRDAVTLKKVGDEWVLSIPDGQNGAMWYAIRLSQRRLTGPKQKLAGKWVEAAENKTFILEADGTATTRFDDNKGTWQANNEDTVLVVRWKRGGWTDLLKLEDRKWTKYSYEHGIFQGQNDITPP